ncbi:MAG TPA: L-threonylcarbamoyladenylate synthase [Vicinamibacterales bacterium]|nr:L-threonylcarbamoyladenylate synthase [Vicinamibacterales bacterium]
MWVDPAAPQRDAIEEAAKWILAGRVVAIPTDTLYGLAVDPWSAVAVDALFAAKDRPAERAIPLIASDRAQVETAIGPLSPTAARLADRGWPGPLTLVVPAPPALAAAVTGGTGTVGVRVPNHDVARAIARLAGRPITATSANLSGEPATDDPDRVEASLGDRIQMLVDVGRTAGGPPSTIVDVTGAAPRLLRAGAVAWDEIERWL